MIADLLLRLGHDCATKQEFFCTVDRKQDIQKSLGNLFRMIVQAWRGSGEDEAWLLAPVKSMTGGVATWMLSPTSLAAGVLKPTAVFEVPDAGAFALFCLTVDPLAWGFGKVFIAFVVQLAFLLSFATTAFLLRVLLD